MRAEPVGKKPKSDGSGAANGPRTFNLERLLAIFYSIIIEPVDASSELLAQIS